MASVLVKERVKDLELVVEDEVLFVVLSLVLGLGVVDVVLLPVEDVAEVGAGVVTVVSLVVGESVA